jgi:hypothetical protein
MVAMQMPESRRSISRSIYYHRLSVYFQAFRAVRSRAVSGHTPGGYLGDLKRLLLFFDSVHIPMSHFINAASEHHRRLLDELLANRTFQHYARTGLVTTTGQTPPDSQATFDKYLARSSIVTPIPRLRLVKPSPVARETLLRVRGRSRDSSASSASTLNVFARNLDALRPRISQRDHKRVLRAVDSSRGVDGIPFLGEHFLARIPNLPLPREGLQNLGPVRLVTRSAGGHDARHESSAL